MRRAHVDQIVGLHAVEEVFRILEEIVNNLRDKQTNKQTNRQTNIAITNRPMKVSKVKPCHFVRLVPPLLDAQLARLVHFKLVHLSHLLGKVPVRQVLQQLRCLEWGLLAHWTLQIL